LGAADDSRNAQILRYHETLLLTRLGRFEEALAAAHYFAKQHLSSPDLYVALGLAALRIPQLPANVSDQQREEFAAAGQAVFLLQSGDTHAADDALQQFFARYPKTANLHYTWGYLLYPTDQDAAISEFRREVSVDPQNAVAHSMLAWALLMEDDAARAAFAGPRAAGDGRREGLASGA
jgi:tetratricopeptide (TPR) repeat protein